MASESINSYSLSAAGPLWCIWCSFKTDETKTCAEQAAAMVEHLNEKHPTDPLTAEQKETLRIAAEDPKDRRIEELETRLKRIIDWCEAYPVEHFLKPDMKEVKRMLGPELLTRLSAYNFRHVLDGIKAIAEPPSTEMAETGKEQK